MSTGPRKRVNATLAACILGLAICSIAFIVVGTGDFSPAFYRRVLPAYVVSGGFLVIRYLAKPRSSTTKQIVLPVIEGLSWVVVGAFLFLVSQVNLLVGVARLSAIGEAFLLASLVCLPFTLARRSALEQRLAALPRIASLWILVLVLLTAAIAVIAGLGEPPCFPGGAKC